MTNPTKIPVTFLFLIFVGTYYILDKSTILWGEHVTVDRGAVSFRDLKGSKTWCTILIAEAVHQL